MQAENLNFRTNTAEQWCNQEQLDFTILPMFLILTSVSANIPQNYVWKILFIEEILMILMVCLLQISKHTILPQIPIQQTSRLQG